MSKLPKTPSPAHGYDESKIKTLSSLEHIRARTGMYIGRLGDGSHYDDGAYVLLKEVVDNAVDEFIMGHGSEIVLTIEDDGAPFNPLHAPLAPPSASIDEAKLGGLGLRLVQGAAKRIAYERRDRHNRVTVVLGLN